MRKLLILLILISFQCSDKEPRTFYSMTSRIFFNGDITNVNQQLEDFYDSCKYLQVDTPTGYTTYPTVEALDSSDHSTKHYRFKTHPFLPFRIKGGSLLLRKVMIKGKQHFFPPAI